MMSGTGNHQDKQGSGARERRSDRTGAAPARATTPAGETSPGPRRQTPPPRQNMTPYFDSKRPAIKIPHETKELINAGGFIRGKYKNIIFRVRNGKQQFYSSKQIKIQGD